MSKAIFRLEKIKTNDAIRKSSAHNFRFQKVENADANKLKDNVVLKKPASTNLLKAFNNKIESEKITVRNSQTVKMLDLFFSASPDFFQNMSKKKSVKYFKDCVQWAEDHFGKDNVMCAIAHYDEKTPHMHLQIVPNDHGKLNAKKWTAGRKMMSDMQTDFANHVINKGWKLERGVIGSTATHQSVKEFYTVVNESENYKPNLFTKIKAIKNISDVLEKTNSLMNYNKFMQNKYTEKNTMLKQKNKNRDSEINELTEKLETERNKNTIMQKQNSELKDKIESFEKEKILLHKKYHEVKTELNKLSNKNNNNGYNIK